MRFMIVGNAPTCGTGYGVQINHLARNLVKHGHDVAVACTFGHQVGVRTMPVDGGSITLYPSGWLENSVDVLIPHALQFFGGDPKGGWIVPVTDVWCLLPVELEAFNVLAWTPVDHWPAPAEVLRFFHKNAARPVAMSRYGQQQLIEAGLSSAYVPLSVDTTVYHPTHTVTIDGEPVDTRELFGIPKSVDFVVLMVAMNKDPDDRKNFDGAFRAFGRFWKEHQNSFLYVHTEKYGLAGSHINLMELARHASIPPHAIRFSETYAVQIGFSPEMLAGLYSVADVLLCPSKGEGFGVPMIEAQACGTPVIASDFTSQTELVGAGWLVAGQMEFDARQNASYLRPFTIKIIEALLEAYDATRDPARVAELSTDAQRFAAGYDTEVVFARDWLPLIAEITPRTPDADKPPMERVAVLVPVLNRPQNVDRLVDSFRATNDGTARLYFIAEKGDTAERAAIGHAARADHYDDVRIIDADDGDGFSPKMNRGLRNTAEDFVFWCGDDVEFTPGWLEEARKLSDRYDVIGTNDSEPGRVRNVEVAEKRHADHFFVRRSYVDDEGATLDGPGILAPEAYTHWWTDREVVELAKARGVFIPCLESVVIHHHPGYDGREDLRSADATYMKAVDSADRDRKTWLSRMPIIAGYRV